MKVLALFLSLLVVASPSALAQEEADPNLSGERRKEYDGLILNINTLELEVTEKRKQLRQSVRLKNASKGHAQQQAEHIKDIKRLYAELGAKVQSYNQLRTKLRYRFPAKGRVIDRRYLPMRRDSLESFEGSSELDRQLSSVMKQVQSQYAPFTGKELKAEQELLQEKRDRKVRPRLIR